jgi:biotin carboxylase
MSHRVLLVAATTGYQVHSFSEAASRLGIELVLATDRCHLLENPWGDDAIPVRFNAAESGIDGIAARGPFDGILAVGDDPALAAAQIAESLRLRFSPPDAVRAAKDKFLARERFRDAGLLVPRFEIISDPHDAAQNATYPVVLKPTSMSASRGVIRADNPRQFLSAFDRIRKIAGDHSAIQLETFIPGREFALEGILTAGHLQTLALFDKPDPLDGPFFEETIYTTPSRESYEVQESIRNTTQRAIYALGLTDGPIHAEMRVNDRGVWMLEVAARPIGGLCSRVLQFSGGASLEQALLEHAINREPDPKLAPGGHGVMMIPIPSRGVYSGVDGLEQARAVPSIENIIITAKVGQELIPLPEGASYLGFIFARANHPAEAENALRRAHDCLRFILNPALTVVK